MSFKKLPAVKEKNLFIGCLNCSTACLEAPMNMIIAVGFGEATVTKDHKIIYSEMECEHSGIDLWQVRDAEQLARLDPDHDWRITKYGPMHGETFQRHGPGQWVCIESNEGFA